MREGLTGAMLHVLYGMPFFLGLAQFFILRFFFGEGESSEGTHCTTSISPRTGTPSNRPSFLTLCSSRGNLWSRHRICFETL